MANTAGHSTPALEEQEEGAQDKMETQENNETPVSDGSQYQLTKLVGYGAFGVVYQATIGNRQVRIRYNMVKTTETHILIKCFH